MKKNLKSIGDFINERLKVLTIKINFVSLYKFIRKYMKWRKRKPKYALGLVKDKEDPRDMLYKVRKYALLPDSTNRMNIDKFNIRYDQGQLGSCTAQGISEAYRYNLIRNNQKDFAPSRLFAYYIARDDKDNDTGASIRDAFKAVNKYGICSEETVPYVIANFAKTPSAKAFLEALDHQSIQYERLPSTKDAIRDAISQGYPVVYGKKIYSSFMSDTVARTGIVPMPKRCEEEYGGHCMVIFDYDETGTIELNSWSREWGNDGTCHVPWEFVLDNTKCFDFWTFYLVEGETNNN